MGGAVALVGCVGDDSGDDATGTGDDATGDDSGDDAVGGTDDRESDEPQIQTAEEFDSYVSETWVRQEHPDEDSFTQTIYTEWDLAGDRAYRRIETVMGDGDDGDAAPDIEYFVVGNRTYQVFLEECAVLEANLVDPDHVGGQVANIRLPDPGEIEAAENVEHGGTTDLDGRRVDVWEFDLGETIEFQNGELTVYVDTDTAFTVKIEGWYEVGHVDNPGTISFERTRHSFDEPVTVEVPEECEQEP